MGEAIITRRIGGAKTDTDSYAFIMVTCPKGTSLTCELTCTDGLEALIGSTASGSYVFQIPYAATWTITCVTSDGGKESKSVSITAQNQMENIFFSCNVTIFASGSGLASGYSLSGVYLLPAINLTGFSAMEVRAVRVWAIADGYGCGIGISSSTSSDASSKLNFGSTTTETKSLDLSSMTGSKYIMFTGNTATISGTDYIATGHSAASARIYSIILKR